MRRKARRFLTVVLTVLLCVTAPAAGFALRVHAQVYSGKCGQNVTWTLDSSTGALTISGQGRMRNDAGPWSPTPWAEQWNENGLTVRTITIEEGVTSICDNAFYCRGDIESVQIASSVCEIGEDAFYCCSNLKAVSLPGVYEIGTDAFKHCKSLKNIIIGPSLQCIDETAFYGCTSLLAFEVDPENMTFCSEDGVLYNKEKTTLVLYPVGRSDTSFSIPNGVRTIEDFAFSPCTSLACVDFPSSLTRVGEGAFIGCTNLSGAAFLTAENNELSIGWHAFRDCTNLSYLVIPHRTIFGWDVFDHCTSLKTVCYDGTDQSELKTMVNNPVLYGATWYYHNHDAQTETVVRDAVEPTCMSEGYSGGIFYVPCGVPKCAGVTLPAAGHIWDGGVCTKEATCIEEGVMTYTCTRDGSHTRTEAIPKTAHVFGAWKQTKAPTEYDEGEEERVCSACGEKETRSTAKLPATRLVLSKSSVDLFYKDSETLTASEPVTWTSTDETVVRVNADGKLTAVGRGSTAIVAHSVQGDKTAVCNVTVRYTVWQILLRVFLFGFLWY